MRFAWLDAHRQTFIDEHDLGLAPLCALLNVTRQGYFAWKKRKANPPGPAAKRKDERMKQIQQAYDIGRQNYGSPRVHEELKGQGVTINEKTVAKYMQEMSLRADPPKPFRPQTTDSDHDHPIAPNTLDRQFERSKPDQGYVADITYIPTAQGFLFLAVVIDLFSRRVVGHAFADHLRTPLVVDAMTQAMSRRRPAAGSWPKQSLLFHSDRGCQYASADFRALLERHGIEPSMSRTGNCYDNAVAESFFATLKRELVHRSAFADHAQARRAIFEYIEVFYNRQRRHSTLGYVSPEQFEANHAARAA